jgi:hypothetical protein
MSKDLTKLRHKINGMGAPRPLNWELLIEPSGGSKTYRLRVPSGWVVKCADAMCFVPDANHAWEVLQ